MRKFLVFVTIASGLVACENSATAGAELDSAKTKIDTLVNKIENSEVVDSIKSKGGVILDSVKTKGGRLMKKVDVKTDVKTDSVK